MYLGASYESVKQVDAKDWRAMSKDEQNKILSSFDLVYVNDFDIKTTYEYRNGVLTNTKYTIPEESTGLWSWASKTAGGIVDQAVKTGTKIIQDNMNPPASVVPPKTESKGFTMPEIPNWVLPAGLIVIAGVFFMSQQKQQRGV